MTLARVADLVGFVGAVIILGGFAWGSMRNAAPDLPYYLANFGGATMLAFSLCVNFNLPALCLELAWAGVALVGLVRLMLRPAP